MCHIERKVVMTKIVVDGGLKWNRPSRWHNGRTDILQIIVITTIVVI